MRNNNDRKKLILRAIVESYINTGEPVGSKYLIAKENLQYSSATVRNEMAELEDLGYLEQPHTSAGRIPSEKGYRFYVDSLMHDYAMTSDELRQLNSLVKDKVNELDGILERAASLMSSLTNYSALTVRKGRSSSSIISYKVVKLGIDSFLLVIVGSDENVKTRHIHIGEMVDDIGLEKLETSLNSYFCGIDPKNVTLTTMIQFQNEMYGYEYLIPPVMKAIYDLNDEKTSSNVHIEGVNKLLSYPEMQNMDNLSNVLRLMDRKSDLMDVVSKSSQGEVNVYIGNENDIDLMKNSAFVFKNITSSDGVIGTIGIIGPRRMDYSKVVTTLNYLTDSLSELFTRESGYDDFADLEKKG